MRAGGLRAWAARMVGRGGPAQDPAPQDPLLRLAHLLAEPPQQVAGLNTLSSQIDAQIRCNPGRAAHFLQTALYAYGGPHSPLLDRLLIQTLDAQWRSQTSQADKGRALRRKLHLFETTYGTVPATKLYRGALALRGGDRDAALDLQAQAARDIGPSGMPWMHIGAHALRPGQQAEWLTPAASAHVPGTQPCVDWYRQATIPGPITVLASGDSAFFRAYGLHLHAALRALDRAATLHVHIVNMTQACADIIDTLAATDPALSVSTEVYPHKDDRTYFACARFYRLAEIRTQLPQPAYIVDMDNVVTRAPVAALPAFGAMDAAWHAHVSQTWFPWWGPTAFNTYIAAGQGGDRIARWMQAYLATRLHPGDFFKSWWIDQLMLNEIAEVAPHHGLRTTTSRVHALTLTEPMPDRQRLPIRAAFLANDFAG